MTLVSLTESIVVLWSAVLGCGLRRLLRINPESVWERLLIDISMGLGIMSLCMFGFGAVGLLGRGTRYVFPIIGVLGLLPFLRSLRGLFARWHGENGLRSALKQRFGIMQSLVALLLLLITVAALISALAPPSMNDWDSLAYHLSIPKLYIQHGGFYRIDFASHSNFPSLVEMLYIHGLWLKDPVAAKLVHFWFGVLLVGAVAVLVRRHFSAKAAPLAALALAGMPIVLWEATTAYIDLATALYTVLCVHLLLCYFDTDDRRYLVACGISAGFAASTKITGLALIPMLGAWLLFDRFACAKRRLEWKGAVILVGVTLVICSPWYIKSLIYTGSPVYPFFYSIFGGRNWSPALAGNYSALQGQFGMGRDFGSFAFLPYNLTFNSEKFYDMRGLFIGPLMLVSMPVLFCARYRSRKLVGMLLFFICQVVIWFKFTQQSRYLIPAFAVLAALTAALAYSDERLRLTRPALWAAFVATALFGVWTLVPSILSAAPSVFGAESREAYLSHSLDVYPAQKWINEHLDSHAKVALYGDTRGFYLDRDYVWADPGHNAALTRDFASVDDMINYLKSQGVTHAMVNHRFFPQPEDAGGVGALVYQAIDEGRFRQLYYVGDYQRRRAVYEIR